MKLFGILAALLLVVGVAVALGDGDDTPAHDRGPVAIGDVRLISVDSCDDLLGWFREVASDMPAGALGGYGPILYAEGDVAGGAAVRDSAAGAAPAPAAESATSGTDQSTGFSGTNVQEEGVDEPDIVKTNGQVLIRAGYSEIEIVDVSGTEPRLVSSVPVEQGGTEILLSGDRVLALTNVWRQSGSPDQPVASDGDARMMMPVAGSPVTVLTAIDISDPEHPDVVETREIPGSYRSARAVGDAARVVVVNTPMLPPPDPRVYEGADQAEIDRRLEEWKTAAIASMTLDDWAPGTEGDCSSVTRTSQPEGLSTTTVLTLDLAGSLEQLDSDTVVADAGTIYASTDRLVIATSRWSQLVQPDGRVSTEIHAFDISDRAATSYVGSGAVDGYLLNQFSLSAVDGYVRVATTEEAPWNETAQVQETSNGLTVLQEQASGSLVEVGSVDGLGPTERIQAVRYIGDVAYVVTFRQTDPLYAIDLSDPTAPRVAGELKINGYSAYLHPIDDSSTLIGVGQDATDDGQQLGTQIATFDISDIGATTRIDAARIDGGYSSVEYDHKSFLWWADDRVAVLPVEVYPKMAECPPGAACANGAPDEQQPYQGAVAFTIGEDGSIVEAGRVSHQGRGTQPGGWYPILRSVVVGDSLYTVSDAGVLRSSLSSLADEGFARFPAPPQPEPMPMPVEGDGGIGSSGSGTSSAGSAGEG